MNPEHAAKVVRRLALPVILVGGALLWVHYGWLRVPAGMDTLPDTHPPGSVCLIAKRPGAIVPGAVVFVDLAEGGTWLARVEGVRDDGALDLRCDNRRSRFTALEARNPLPRSAVRGLVLSQLVPDAPGAPDAPRGR